jgi:pyruvate-formate lyase-activating enzyme
MQDFQALEPFPSPADRLSFLLDWEVTMKCNLDCSYCNENGHNNKTKHPDYEDCLKSLDFMYKYVDLYMQKKISSLRHVVLNVYGGESLFHPDIVDILKQARAKYQPYTGRWGLTITTTTNAVVPEHRMSEIIPLIDEFTVSYHTESTDKQKQQCKDNILAIKAAGKRIKCIVLMHNQPELFDDATEMINWCDQNDVRRLPRQLDHLDQTTFLYNQNQVVWFDRLYKKRSHNTDTTLPVAETNNLTEVGRSCCGGRQVCVDQNFKQRHAFVQNKFTGWHCSVNWFFLFVKQLTGDIYVNKDCKMSFDGTVGPIGNLSTADSLLEQLDRQLSSDQLPVIQCAKNICLCGLCAPKAKTLESYQSLIKKYQVPQGVKIE